MNLYLIRHGQTDWNIQGRIQGRRDIPLNETGLRQAEYLAQGMAHRKVERIYCSTQKRAMETAAAIGRQQLVDVYVIKGLEEVNFGDWEGLTMDEIKRDFPDDYGRWIINPVDVAPPGGENQFQAMERAVTTLRSILAEKTGGDVAIVSHGATLAFMISYMIKNLEEQSEIIVNNASITTVGYNSWTDDFSVISLNDISHLEGI